MGPIFYSQLRNILSCLLYHNMANTHCPIYHQVASYLNLLFHRLSTDTISSHSQEILQTVQVP